jgi:hypothetical protein
MEPPHGSVRRVDLPDEARARCTLARIDYYDAFLVDLDPTREWDGEQWARAMLAQAPLRTRTSLTLAWRALGLRLGSQLSGRLVLGWRIRHSSEEYALLGANGSLGLSAELLYEPLVDTMLFATFVQLDNAYIRVIWRRVIPLHVRAVRSALEQAREKNRGS